VKEEAEQAAKLDPKSDYAWHMIGRWHQGAASIGGLTKGIVKIVYGGLPDASLQTAVDCYNKAIKLKADRVAHHIELGITLATLGKSAEARAAITKGLNLPNRERDDPQTKARGREVLDSLK
jgi:tetratricopeptide (TPR) repeat protein